MIFYVLAASALTGTVTGLAKQVRKIRNATDMLAGTQREEVKAPVHLDLFLSPEQLERLLSDPEIQRAYFQMEALKKVGGVPVCRLCGSSKREGDFDDELHAMAHKMTSEELSGAVKRINEELAARRKAAS